MALHINPIAMIKREMEAKRLSFKRMGTLMDRDPASIQVMLTKDNLSFERLYASCIALEYNFFLEIGYKIHLKGPTEMTGNPLKNNLNIVTAQLQNSETRIAELEKKLNETEMQMKQIESDADITRRLLETELNTLKQVMKDILASRYAG